MPFQDALAQRLDLLKPSRADVEKLLEAKPPQLTPGMADLVDLLKQQGKQVDCPFFCWLLQRFLDPHASYSAQNYKLRNAPFDESYRFSSYRAALKT